ncbi:PqqD family protein [Streptomyces rimosus]|uniref:PqqD family protein n=1 Tax=Streptomyces rimosus TaxID=1927 RepID=UPI000B146576|nr:PqqD family protein [Streptomyces rimosus]
MEPSASTAPFAADAGVSLLRVRALNGLLGHLAPPDREAIRSSAHALYRLLRSQGARNEGTVLVAYGGGKDSSYTVAFTRGMQLLVGQWYGDMFTLRTATNWHAGMPRAVMENIDRVYTALGMHEDPACELLLVEGSRVRPFAVGIPRSREVTARNRADILMTGHRTHADARPTFCNACNLSMANAFGVAASYPQGADVIITGDSAEEQRAYTAWINRLARQVPRHGRPGQPSGFGKVLGAVDDVARAYFEDIHGPQGSRGAGHGVQSEVLPHLQFFSIYASTAYDAGSHWDLLTHHLGFVFDDLAFSFTESDCANPALMAHLRGLKAQYLFHRDYREGLDEYAAFALRLMRRKEFPQPLIDTMAARYAAPEAQSVLRRRVNAFAQEAYGLDERQLVCMVYSPFTGAGAGLRPYLDSRAPHLAECEEAIRHLLSSQDGDGDTDDRGRLAAELEKLSGLELGQLRTLYGSDLNPGLVQSILRGDPHKERIRTRHAPDGPEIGETLSGR